MTCCVPCRVSPPTPKPKLCFQLSPLPALAAHGLTVLPDAREKGNGGPIFSADCVATGRQHLVPRVSKALRWISEQESKPKRGPFDLLLSTGPKEEKPEKVRAEALAQEVARETADKIESGVLNLDVELVAEDAKHHQWFHSAISVLESEQDVDRRVERLVGHLRQLAAAAPSKAAVCVGHSMLFRRVFRNHFGRIARSSGGSAWESSELGQMLQKHVLLNCGMVALDLDDNGALFDIRLLFGSGFRTGWTEPGHDKD